MTEIVEKAKATWNMLNNEADTDEANAKSIKEKAEDDFQKAIAEANRLYNAQLDLVERKRSQVAERRAQVSSQRKLLGKFKVVS